MMINLSSNRQFSLSCESISSSQQWRNVRRSPPSVTTVTSAKRQKQRGNKKTVLHSSTPLLTTTDGGRGGCLVIKYRDITSHKEVEGRFRGKVMRTSTPVRPVDSPGRSPAEQREEILLRTSAVNPFSTFNCSNFRTFHPSTGILEDYNNNLHRQEESLKNSPLTCQCHLSEALDQLITLIPSSAIPDDKFVHQVIESVGEKVKMELEIDFPSGLHLIDQFNQDVKELYLSGGRIAILNYLLLSGEERTRLGLGRQQQLQADKTDVKIEQEEKSSTQCSNKFSQHESELDDKCCLSSQWLTMTIRAPLPWRHSKEKSEGKIGTFFSSVYPLLEEVQKAWFQGYGNQGHGGQGFSSLSLLDKISFPVDSDYFQSRVELNCQLIKTSLTFDWVSVVAGIYNQWKKGELKRKNSDRVRRTRKSRAANPSINQSVTDCVPQSEIREILATLMSRLLRQLIIDNIETWVREANNTDERREEREIFIARANFWTGHHESMSDLSFDQESNDFSSLVTTSTIPLMTSLTGLAASIYSPIACHLEPSPTQWPKLLLHPITKILEATKEIPRIEKYLTVLPDDEYAGRLPM